MATASVQRKYPEDHRVKRTCRRKNDVEVERVTAREFIRIWQTSNSVAEVAKKTGCTKKTVRVRGWRYRSLFDIPLKVFPTSAFDYPDWDELAAYAESLVRESTGEVAAEDATS
jgi:hypothetical protein